MNSDNFKTCGRCKKQVPDNSIPGDQCPHCGVTWVVERSSEIPEQVGKEMKKKGQDEEKPH